MNEQDIKKKIKQEAQKIEIRTSANYILERYRVENLSKKVKPWYKRPAFLYGVSAFSVLVIVLGVGLGLSLGHNITDNPGSSIGPTITIPPARNQILNQASYEILACSSFIDSGSAVNPQALSLLNSVDSYDGKDSSSNNIKDAVKAFDFYRPMMIELEKKNSEGDLYIPIESDDKNYSFAIQIEDNLVLYYNDAFEEKDDDEISKTYDALLKDGENNYKVKIEKSIEKEEGETETEISSTIYTDEKNYIQIKNSNEVEGAETEKSYELSKIVDGEETTKIVFDFEEEDSDIEKKLDIEKDPRFEDSYEYEIKDLKNDGDNYTFTLIYDDENISYKDNGYVYQGVQIYP